MSKACVMLTTIKFSLGESSTSEIKCEVLYNFTPRRPTRINVAGEAPQVDIKTIRFQHKDGRRVYWVDLPDWMMEYIVSNESFLAELISNAED